MSSMGSYKNFRDELEHLLNAQSMENASNTPDFILANFLTECLRAFDTAVRRRSRLDTGRIECDFDSEVQKP